MNPWVSARKMIQAKVTLLPRSTCLPQSHAGTVTKVPLLLSPLEMEWPKLCGTILPRKQFFKDNVCPDEGLMADDQESWFASPEFPQGPLG